MSNKPTCLFAIRFVAIRTILHSNLRLSHYAVAALSEGLAQLQLTGSGLT